MTMIRNHWNTLIRLMSIITLTAIQCHEPPAEVHTDETINTLAFKAGLSPSKKISIYLFQ